LSTEAAVEFLSYLADDAFFELKYDDFIEYPVNTISQVLEFIGIDDDLEVKNFVTSNLVRKTSKLGKGKVSGKNQILGGKLLPLSIDGAKGLTNKKSCFAKPKHDFGLN